MLNALGRFIARHARWVALGWLVVVLLGYALATGALGGRSLFARLQSGAPSVPGESQTAQDLLARTAPTGPQEYLVLDRVDPQSAVVRAAVTAATGELAATPGVVSVQDPYRPGPEAAAMVATDRRAVLVSVSLAPNLGAREDVLLARVSSRLEQVQAQVPGSRGLVGGRPSLVKAITDQVPADLRTGEGIALPVSLLVMVLVFGGFLAAGLPLLGALASISGALVSLLGFSYRIDLDASVVNVVTVLGLGLCIDYGLLLASRYREELRRLHDAEPERPERLGRPGRRDRPDRAALEAVLERTMSSAGRTVLFSAVTVAISSSGLLLFSSNLLRAVGAAAVSVVLIALLVALTLVPSMLALAGDRMIRPGITVHRVPGLNRLARRLGDVAPPRGAFSRLAEAVQRRPGAVLLAVLAVLGLAAWPALGMQLVNSGVALLPVDAPQRQLFDAIDTRFPTAAQPPITVVAVAPPDQVRRWATSSVPTLPGVAGVTAVTQQGDASTGRISVFEVRTQGGALSAPSRAALAAVRAQDPGFPVYVTGHTSYVVDFVDDLVRHAPEAIAVVVAATFVLLFLMTGSVLIPVKALLMNVVSLGASFGVLVWVFQEGHLEHVLAYSSAGGIETLIPALTLAFGFGLAMDYEVFLLSRIKEHRDRGADNDEAVVRGLQASGRIITSAALIVVIVFAGFAGGKLLVIKETGVALAVAVTVDATLVRMLLVPAAMSLLGDWNWWAPAPLRRLHRRFGVREG